MTEKNPVYENLKMWILQLPSVSESPHRFGGTEFQVGGIEFMHSHGPTWLDVRLSKEDQTLALKMGQVLRHRFAPQAGWVSLRIGSQEDIVNAKKIIRLAYENTRKNIDDVISRRSHSRPG
jgi:hypothetical protein